MLQSKQALTLKAALKIIEGSVQKAQEIGVDMDIAVCDDGGHLIAFQRMDGAKITSIDIAINKAFTAAGTRKKTSEYRSVSGCDGPAFGIFVSNQGKFMVFGGGVPIVVNGEVIGAVGCSSGSPEQDEAVACAGIEALLRELKS